MAVLLCVGGSTLLYVVATFLLAKGDGFLDALSVSPLGPWGYIASKVITLTGVATLEAVLLVGAVLVWLGRQHSIPWPNSCFFVGIVYLGAQHVLVGIILVVRYERISEALMPGTVFAFQRHRPVTNANRY